MLLADFFARPAPPPMSAEFVSQRKQTKNRFMLFVLFDLKRQPARSKIIHVKGPGLGEELCNGLGRHWLLRALQQFRYSCHFGNTDKRGFPLKHPGSYGSFSKLYREARKMPCWPLLTEIFTGTEKTPGSQSASSPCRHACPKHS